MTAPGSGSPGRTVPEDPLAFIVRCVRARRVYWTYHVNMRLADRRLSPRDVCEATGTYELVEAYPDDKYLPSYLVFASTAGHPFHDCSRRTWQVTTCAPSPCTVRIRTIGNPT